MEMDLPASKLLHHDIKKHSYLKKMFSNDFVHNRLALNNPTLYPTTVSDASQAAKRLNKEVISKCLGKIQPAIATNIVQLPHFF
jgi:hypothetical protein